jgi:hypothetical protein
MKIEIYPDCPKPKWMKVGAWCHCLGEGNDKFIVDQIFNVSATLLTFNKKHAHGMESFSKLYQNIKELDQRKKNNG